MKAPKRAGRSNGAYQAPLGSGPFSRVCPRCQAQPGRRCTRVVAGTGEVLILSRFHLDRRRRAS